MEDFSHVELAELVDLLNIKTATYNTMLRTGAASDQVELCKKEIRQIQQDIRQRSTVQSPADIIAPCISVPDNSFS